MPGLGMITWVFQHHSGLEVCCMVQVFLRTALQQGDACVVGVLHVLYSLLYSLCG